MTAVAWFVVSLGGVLLLSGLAGCRYDAVKASRRAAQARRSGL
jgi:hypothetical protein